MCKYIRHIPNTEVYFVKGATISGLSYQLLQSDINLLNYRIIIIHVGTNDVRQREMYEIECHYKALIYQIHHINKEATIILSSVLHRPVDFHSTESKVIKINQCLKDLSKKYLYCANIKTYKSFMKKGAPNTALYARKDGGLHLNQNGTFRLRSLFKNHIVLKSRLIV